MASIPYSRDPRPTGAKTAAVLDVIRSHVAAYGYAPSIREIMELAGISTTSVVAYHLSRLEAAGVIERALGAARAMRVVA